MKKRGIALFCILALLASSLLSGNFGAVAASDIASQATNSEVKWNAITWNQDTFEMTYNDLGNAKQGVLKNPTSFDKTIFSLKFTFVDTTNTGDGLYFGANKDYGGVAFRRENDSTTGEDYLVIGNQVGNQGWTYSQLPWTAYKIYASTVWGDGQTSWREKEFLLQIATEIVGDDVRFYIGINGELQRTKDGADYYTISGGASALGTGFFIGGDNHKGKPTAYTEHCYSATGTPIHDYANYTLNADGTETGHCVVEGCTATYTRQPEVKWNAITWNKDTFEMTYNDLGNAKQGVLKNPTSFDKTIFSLKFTFTDCMTSTGEGLYYGANGGYGGVAFRRECDSTTGEDYLVIGNQVGNQGWTYSQFPWTVYKIFASEIWGEGETNWGNKEFLLQIATEIVGDDVKFYIGINGKLQKTKDGADYCIIAGGASALGTQFRIQGNYHYGKPTAYTEHSYSATGTAIHDYADYTPNADGTETGHCVVEGCTATDTRQIEVKWNAITWNQDTFEMTYNDLGNANRGVLKNPTSFDKTIFSLKFTFVDTTNTGDGLYYGTNTSYGGVAFRRENDSTTGEDYLVIGNQVGNQGWTYSQLPWTAYKIYASTVWGDGQTSWREKEFLLQIATEIVEDDVRFYIGINGELQKTKDGADYYTISGGASALGTGFFIQGDNHKGKPTAYTEHCYNTSGKPIHNYDLRVVKDATCLEEGIKAGTCTLEGCSATSGNITFEAYGHKYVDSVCERCGAEQSVFDVAPYKEDGTHPIKNGSLFAGWYTGDNYGKETVYTEKTGTATAKFADAKLMNVAAQLAIYGTGEQQTVWKDGKTKMRLVFTLDSTDYHDVGFYVQFEGYSEGKYSSKTVFTKIVANENGVPFEYEPTNYLGDKSSESAKYFVTATITGIPETASDMNITITPYWVTLDGTEVKGEPTIKTVNQGIYAGNKYTGSDALDENAVVANYSFATIGGTDVMPIVGYYGPALTEDKTVTTTSGTYTLPSHLTDAMFSKIAESGINTIGKNDLDYASSSNAVITALELLAEKHGLTMLVTDSLLSGTTGQTMNKEEVSARVNEYYHYASYAGNAIVDEPGYDLAGYKREGRHIDNWKNIFQRFQENKLYAYGNLLPLATVKTGGPANYQVYAKYYLDNCKVPYLSFDQYVFNGKDNSYSTAMQHYFANLALIRKTAEEYSIPFWTFVQAGANFGVTGVTDNTVPTQGQFFWNVGTQLAFGSKGIQYFTLFQPTYFAPVKDENGTVSDYDFDRNGLIGADGTTTKWFDYAKAMNAQIAAVDDVLMNSVNMGILVTGEQAKKDVQLSTATADNTLAATLEGYVIGTIGEAKWRELTDIDGAAMIGCFNYNGKTALYVVNYDMEKTQDITLHFDKIYSTNVVQDARKRVSTQKDLTLSLTAGNSALIVFP